MVQQSPAEAREPQSSSSRRRSRVKAEHRYPTYDLNDSVDVARRIAEDGGGSASPDHLASFLNYKSTTSGAFLTRIAAARLFGLIERRGQEYVPTARARKILNPERPGVDDAAARVEAFRAVPLYRTLIDRYRGQPLPPEVGLRNAMMTNYDIPDGRTQVAYRVFMDSADQAGFFEARQGQRTHLVEPQVSGPSIQPDASPPPDEDEASDDGEPAAIPPSSHPPATTASVTEKLQEALVEKVRQLEPSDLETIREYIKEIERLGKQAESKEVHSD